MWRMVNGSGVARIDYAPGPVDLSGLDWFGGQFAPDRFVRRMIARTYRTEVRIRWGSLKMARRRPGCVQGSAGRVRGCEGAEGVAARFCASYGVRAGVGSVERSPCTSRIDGEGAKTARRGPAWVGCPFPRIGPANALLVRPGASCGGSGTRPGSRIAPGAVSRPLAAFPGSGGVPVGFRLRARPVAVPVRPLRSRRT